MRDYGKVSPKFWTGETGQELARRGSEAVVVGLYLMTSPHSNMLGLYYQPVLYMAEETGLSPEGASKGLAHCVEAGFCEYDHGTKMVWVYEMASYQIGSELDPKDKRCKGVQKEYSALPNNPFLGAFFDHYAGKFHLTDRREFALKVKGLHVLAASPIEAPSKPRAGAGAGTGTEQEQRRPSASSPAKLPTCDVSKVIDVYHEALPELPKVRLHTKDRVRVIRRVWEWLFTDPKPSDKLPRAKTAEEALDWFRRYFLRARDNDFLMGRTPRTGEHANWKPDIDFLLSDKGKKQVLEKTPESD